MLVHGAVFAALLLGACAGPAADPPAFESAQRPMLLAEQSTALPAFPGGSAGWSGAAVRGSSAGALSPVETAAGEGILDQHAASLDSEAGLMIYEPGDGLAWIIYERQDIDADFYPEKFWLANNGLPHFIAVANFSTASWELYPGRHQYYSDSGVLSGGKTSLLHPWNQYVSTEGKLYLAVLTQSVQLESSTLGLDMKFEPLDAPSGLHVKDHLFHVLNIAWNSYSDPRDLRLELRYIQNGGNLRKKLMSEDTTSTTLVLYPETVFCLVTYWPDKGIYGPESPWVTDTN